MIQILEYLDGKLGFYQYLLKFTICSTLTKKNIEFVHFHL